MTTTGYDTLPPPAADHAAVELADDAGDAGTLDDESGYDDLADGAETDPAWDERKQAILADFAEWLDALVPEERPAPEAETPENAAPGLLQLFGELAALRQEVNLQTRENRKLGGSVAAAETNIAQTLQQVTRGFDRIEEGNRRLAEARLQAQREILDPLLDLAETVRRTAGAPRQPPPAPPFLARLFGARTDTRQADRDTAAFQLLADKAAATLAALNLTPVAERGGGFDPKTMKAVATASGAGVPPGRVADVQRQGYLFRGNPIRTADVTVEKP
jgi:hypothetical protein